MDKGISFCFTSKTITTLLINCTQYEVKTLKKKRSSNVFLKEKENNAKVIC